MKNHCAFFYILDRIFSNPMLGKCVINSYRLRLIFRLCSLSPHLQFMLLVAEGLTIMTMMYMGQAQELVTMGEGGDGKLKKCYRVIFSR